MLFLFWRQCRVRVSGPELPGREASAGLSDFHASVGLRGSRASTEATGEVSAGSSGFHASAGSSGFCASVEATGPLLIPGIFPVVGILWLELNAPGRGNCQYSMLSLRRSRSPCSSASAGSSGVLCLGRGDLSAPDPQDRSSCRTPVTIIMRNCAL